MEYRNKDNKLLREVEPVITGLGYSIIDFVSHRNEKNLHVGIIIYKEDGISIEDCALVHRTLFPRIEVLEETRDVHMEVSSPGTNRNIKSIDEFIVFIGKNVRILVFDDSEWIHGKIIFVRDDYLSIDTGDTTIDISYIDIKKAKLE